MKGQNKVNRDGIINAFYTQRIATPQAAPLHHYSVLFSAGLIDCPYTEKEVKKMACESVMRILTIEIDNLAADIAPMVEKPQLTGFEQLRYNRLMRNKELAMAARGSIAQIAIGRTISDAVAHRLVSDMVKRHEIYWSKPIALITNLGD